MTKETKPTVVMVKGKSLSPKLKSHEGRVVSAKMAKAVVVEWERRVYIPKYERYLTKKTKIHAHVPEHLDIKEDDKVKVQACRPISKTIHHIVTEKLE